MEEINHEYYVSLEVAKLLREAGFDWECEALYDRMGDFIHILYDAVEWDFGKINWNGLHKKQAHRMGIADWEEGYSAPTLEVAQRWLREVKNIDVVVSRAMQWKQFYYTITHEENRTSKIDFMSLNKDLWWFKYEEALEAGIQKALEIILKKGK